MKTLLEKGLTAQTSKRPARFALTSLGVTLAHTLEKGCGGDGADVSAEPSSDDTPPVAVRAQGGGDDTNHSSGDWDDVIVLARRTPQLPRSAQYAPPPRPGAS